MTSDGLQDLPGAHASVVPRVGCGGDRCDDASRTSVLNRSSQCTAHLSLDARAGSESNCTHAGGRNLGLELQRARTWS